MVRDLQRVIGDEARVEMLRREGVLPNAVVSCVGGGSNAIRNIYSILGRRRSSALWRRGWGIVPEPGCHSASLTLGRPGVLHGSLTMVLQDDDGQILPAHSISAGLDYPGVGPEHAALAQSGRVKYVAVSDEQALEASTPHPTGGDYASAGMVHAVALGCAIAQTLSSDEIVLITLSRRGDKDLDTVLEALHQQSEGG